MAEILACAHLSPPPSSPCFHRPPVHGSGHRVMTIIFDQGTVTTQHFVHNRTGNTLMIVSWWWSFYGWMFSRRTLVKKITISRKKWHLTRAHNWVKSLPRIKTHHRSQVSYRTRPIQHFFRSSFTMLSLEIKHRTPPPSSLVKRKSYFNFHDSGLLLHIPVLNKAVAPRRHLFDEGCKLSRVTCILEAIAQK